MPRPSFIFAACRQTRFSRQIARAAGAKHRLRATLPQPRVGKFAISARYRMAETQTASAGSALQVPLLSPVDTRVTSQRATVRAPSGVFLSLGTNADGTSWKMNDTTRKKN